MFHQLEASLRAKQNSPAATGVVVVAAAAAAAAAAGCASPLPPPPPPTVIVTNTPPPPIPHRHVFKSATVNNLNRKHGLKISECYLADLPNRNANYSNRDRVTIKTGGGGVGSGSVIVRRTSCPSFISADPNKASQDDEHWSTRCVSRRRANRHQRFLTADLHADIVSGKLKSPYADSGTASAAITSNNASNAIHLWTSGLMAEFNDVINTELIRLATNTAADSTPMAAAAAAASTAAPVSVATRTPPTLPPATPVVSEQFHNGRYEKLDNSNHCLSSWAKIQLSLIEKLQNNCTPPAPPSAAATLTPAKIGRPVSKLKLPDWLTACPVDELNSENWRRCNKNLPTKNPYGNSSTGSGNGSSNSSNRNAAVEGMATQSSACGERRKTGSGGDDTRRHGEFSANQWNSVEQLSADLELVQRGLSDDLHQLQTMKTDFVSTNIQLAQCVGDRRNAGNSPPVLVSLTLILVLILVLNLAH